MQYEIKDNQAFRVINGERIPVPEHKISGMKPRNVEQAIAFDACLDMNNTLTVMRGEPGTGKTGIAVWAALALAARGEVWEVLYTRLPVPKGPSLGAIPGDMGTKHGPWIQAFYDQAQYVPGFLEKVREKGRIDHPPVEFIKSRTFNNAIMILDEAQDLTEEEVEAVLGRMGNHARIIVCGDPGQIDRKGNTPERNGLVHIARLAGLEPDVAYVNLIKPERGRGAELSLSLRKLRSDRIA